MTVTATQEEIEALDRLNRMSDFDYRKHMQEFDEQKRFLAFHRKCFTNPDKLARLYKQRFGHDLV